MFIIFNPKSLSCQKNIIQEQNLHCLLYNPKTSFSSERQIQTKKFSNLMTETRIIQKEACKH